MPLPSPYEQDEQDEQNDKGRLSNLAVTGEGQSGIYEIKLRSQLGVKNSRC